MMTSDRSLNTRLELEKLIFGHEFARRFTQDSPFLPDVWIAYGQNPGKRVDVLINPYGETLPGKVFLALKERLDMLPPPGPDENESRDIAYNRSVVVARLTFEELVLAVLPMTSWWADYVIKKEKRLAGGENPDPDKERFFHRSFLDNTDDIVTDMRNWNDPQTSNSVLKFPPEWLWMISVIGRIWAAQKSGSEDGRDIQDITDAEAIEMFNDLMRSVVHPTEGSKSLVFSVTLNRPATTAVWRSTVAVKADSGRLLFNVNCKKLSWAIVDSGIDAKHPAFRCRDAEGRPMELDPADWTKQTRIKATYDFTRMREILTTLDGAGPAGSPIVEAVGNLVPADDRAEMARSLRAALTRGFHIDWEIFEPFLRVPHNAGYRAPLHDHGTHVAGILAGDWRKDENHIDEAEDLTGVCPDINLYDFRVLDDSGRGDEFSVMAALQFTRYLNSHKEFTSVHGVNMSLSIHHDVVNYACGRTPVCEECDRLTHSGTVVVAAAGNQGYLKYLMADGRATEGYRSISVTDPGNAESVITVGSTHSTRPHSYGVSYFSSRGPTGDGRIKPDLVAPGEKIKSPLPNGQAGPKDGTSMAAPHVSGAAAMLMARHTELNGDPARIKEILCKTATDLGREHYFQGAGMIDILRALQSV